MAKQNSESCKYCGRPEEQHKRTDDLLACLESRGIRTAVGTKTRAPNRTKIAFDFKQLRLKIEALDPDGKLARRAFVFGLIGVAISFITYVLFRPKVSHTEEADTVRRENAPPPHVQRFDHTASYSDWLHQNLSPW